MIEFVKYVRRLFLTQVSVKTFVDSDSNGHTLNMLIDIQGYGGYNITVHRPTLPECKEEILKILEGKG